MSLQRYIRKFWSSAVLTLTLTLSILVGIPAAIASADQVDCAAVAQRIRDHNAFAARHNANPPNPRDSAAVAAYNAEAAQGNAEIPVLQAQAAQCQRQGTATPPIAGAPNNRCPASAMVTVSTTQASGVLDIPGLISTAWPAGTDPNTPRPDGRPANARPGTAPTAVELNPNSTPEQRVNDPAFRNRYYNTRVDENYYVQRRAGNTGVDSVDALKRPIPAARFDLTTNRWVPVFTDNFTPEIVNVGTVALQPRQLAELQAIQNQKQAAQDRVTALINKRSSNAPLSTGEVAQLKAQQRVVTQLGERLGEKSAQFSIEQTYPGGHWLYPPDQSSPSGVLDGLYAVSNDPQAMLIGLEAKGPSAGYSQGQMTTGWVNRTLLAQAARQDNRGEAARRALVALGRGQMMMTQVRTLVDSSGRVTGGLLSNMRDQSMYKGIPEARPNLTPIRSRNTGTPASPSRVPGCPA